MRVRFARAIGAALALGMVVAACGASAGQQRPKVSGTDVPSPTSTPPPALHFNPAAAQDVAGLHVELIGADVDRHLTGDPVADAEPSVGIDCGQSLVLASDRLVYSAAEMRDLSAFVAAYTPGKGKSPERYVDPATLPPLPPTLALATGRGNVCDGEFQVTNTGAATVQLLDLGVTLNVATTANAFTYRLIDACPILYPDPMLRLEQCPPPLGAGLACSYAAQVALAAVGVEGAGAQTPPAPIQGFDPRLPGESPCPQLTLSPNQEITVIATFSPPTAAEGALVYDVTPYLTVAGGQGTQEVQLDRLRSTLVFAGAGQSACYQPTGDTFALPVPEATSPAVSGAPQQLFCI